MPSLARTSLLAISALVVLSACARRTPPSVDLDAIRVSSDAHLRTDTVGEGEFASVSTFVLVDADNTASQGAYVTLGGELTDAAGATVGQLKPQSLWIPAGGRRTFALVDLERTPRPTTTSARVKVHGATVLAAPLVRIDELHVFDDYGKTVVQANVVNDVDRIGKVMVIGAFHDAGGRPMTRPFQMIEIDRKAIRPVQFVGPPGSTHGTIFVGDIVY